MLEHFAINNSMLSYPKLIKFVKHQINEYEKMEDGIKDNALYYVLHDPDALKDISMIQDKMDEWKWFLEEILEDELKINALTI